LPRFLRTISMNFLFSLVPLGQQSRILVRFWGGGDEGMKLAPDGVEFSNPISIALRIDLARNLENEQALYTKTPKLGNITSIQLKRCVS
jgi:hypothetical protein